MRKLLCSTLLVCVLVFNQASAQRMEIPNMKVNSYGYSMPQNFYAPNGVGNTSATPDIQTQFNIGQWTRGSVKFQNGQQMNDMLLLFDVHNNKLYFKQDGTTMEFIYPVYEFSIGLMVGEDTGTIYYRAYYPAVNKNTGETFYEVIVDAGIQLLRCRAKNVNLYRDEAEPEQKRKTAKEQWFVYTGGKMIFIKKDKKNIQNALPAHADEIESIVQRRGLNLSNSGDLIDLFAELNKL